MPIQLGSKFTGKPQGFADTTNGIYWEVLPKIEGDAGRLQRGLLAPRKTAPDSLPTLDSRYTRMLGTETNNQAPGPMAKLHNLWEYMTYYVSRTF